MRTIQMTKSERDQIEAALTSELARVQRSKEEPQAHALTEALRRLREGEYGVCIYCGGQIPTGRLLVIPETEHCLDCQRAA